MLPWSSGICPVDLLMGSRKYGVVGEPMRLNRIVNGRYVRVRVTISGDSSDAAAQTADDSPKADQC
jgi:hypothetical protein